MEPLNLIGTISAIFISLAGFLLAVSQYKRQKRREESGDLAELIRRITSLEASHAQIDVKVALFWKAMESAAVKMIHCPDTPEIDELLDRYHGRKASKDEIIELRRQLNELTNAEGEKRTGALLLLMTMDLKEYFE